MKYKDEALCLHKIMPIHIKYLMYIFGSILASFALINYCFIMSEVKNVYLENINTILRDICTGVYLVIFVLAVFIKYVFKWKIEKVRQNQFIKFLIVCGALLFLYYIEILL